MTIVCILGFAWAGLACYSYIAPAIRQSVMANSGPLVMAVGIPACLLRIAAYIGLWKMRKWGAYVYVCSVVIQNGGGYLVHHTIGGINLWVPVAVLAVCAAYFKKMV